MELSAVVARVGYLFLGWFAGYEMAGFAISDGSLGTLSVVLGTVFVVAIGVTEWRLAQVRSDALPRQ